MFYMEKAVDALGIGIPETFEQAVNERNGWILTAAQAEKNIDYYRGLLLEIGVALGDEARRDNEGQLHELPFPSKVKELAIERLQFIKPERSQERLPKIDMMNLHPAGDPYRGSPHKFSRIPLPSGAPRMPSAAELIAEADEIGFGRLDNELAKRP